MGGWVGQGVGGGHQGWDRTAHICLPLGGNKVGVDSFCVYSSNTHQQLFVQLLFDYSATIP